ncbi:gamma-glutamyltransferase [Bacteroidota bacterium]
MRYLPLIIFLLICASITSQDRPTGRNFVTRSEVIAQHGMAATSQPLATQAAIDILKKGGNAIDAAIAANAVLGLVAPMSCGIGGDLFAILWDAKTQKLYGLNASGRSPKSLTLKILKAESEEEIAVRGPLPISTPGCVDGWFELHKKFGKLNFNKILQPAIQYARNGFPVPEIIANYWKGSEYLKEFPGFQETYFPRGTVPQKGEIFKNSALADSYELIAEEGRDVYYKGKIARKIHEFMKDNNGYLSYDDLKSHYSEWIEPVSTNFRGYNIWELPPNGQGIAVLQMLNILEGYNLSEMGYGSKEYLHVLIEAKKLAYEDRAKYYSDPAFNDIPIDKLISKEYADRRRTLIDPEVAADRYNPGELEDGDTIYLTVADCDGNMISLIQSNYYGFGSAMVSPKLGFALQNRGALFTLEEGHANQFEPGKRPFHTIIPGFVTKNNEPFMSFGVMGGAMQPQGHAQVLINLIEFGMSLQEAGDAPRIRHFGSSQPTGSVMSDGGYLSLESGFDPDVIRDLSKMGHTIKYEYGVYGGYQAIMYDAKNKVFYGASESRKDGHAAGY